MGFFFGIDGIRGQVNDDLSQATAYKCGNALAGKNKNAKILIGRDTRRSGSFIALAFATGAMNAGASVVDVGVCPTAGISYLTQKLGFDFGVIISASHNTAEFNGIKIFDSHGRKLTSKQEDELEKLFLREFIVSFDEIGTYEYNPRLAIKYEEFLSKSIKTSLKGKTIVLDCANGASYKLAPAVFRDNKAKIIATFCKPDGLNINKGCGTLNIERLQKYVLKYNADMGFAFDGDSDRVIAVDEKGNVLDGDKLLYIFAMDYMEKGKLNKNAVVGTRHTNMGVENALKKQGIKLIRSDIGDKYVSLTMQERDLNLGGEQSGHIVNREKLETGDGVLNALAIAEIVASGNKKLSEYIDFELYKQCNINVRVHDKMRIINSAELTNMRDEQEKLLGDSGRIMIRVSGTEPYIRVMVETKDEQKSKDVAKLFEELIKILNKEDYICAE